MSEQAGQFRSAAFGGFHRQDVLDYLEQMTKERQDLEARLTSESEARSQAETRLTQAEAEAAAAREAQETMVSELDYLRGEVDARSAALTKAEEEVKVLRAQVDALRPGAESWENLKERAGDIELSAHERAQVTIQDAQSQAAEIQAEGVKWVLGIQAGCEKLQKDLNAAIRAAEYQLDTARSAFRQTEREMKRYEASLEALLSDADRSEQLDEGQ